MTLSSFSCWFEFDEVHSPLLAHDGGGVHYLLAHDLDLPSRGWISCGEALHSAYYEPLHSTYCEYLHLGHWPTIYEPQSIVYCAWLAVVW